MATKQPTPVPPSTLREDETALIALKKMAGYNPGNPDLKADAIQTLVDGRKTAAEAEKLAVDALGSARKASDAANRAFHNAMKQAKKAVSSQFGEDSDEVASLGLKRANEYKRPVRQKKSAA